MGDGQVTASDVVYLFGDAFAAKDSWRSEGYVLESNGVKVQKHPLMEQMVLAAIAELIQAKWLEVGSVKKGFLVKSDAPVLRRTNSGLYPAGGIERTLLAALRDDEKDNSIDKLMVRIIGTNEEADPWGRVMANTREHLAELGYFRKFDNPDKKGITKIFRSPYKYEADAAKIASANAEIARVKSLLDEAKKSQGKTWENITKQITPAFKSVQPRDDDNDFGSSD